MSAPHFFVDPGEASEIAEGQRLLLSPEDSHHALRVLRVRRGEAVTVANNLGWMGRGVLDGESGGRAVVRVDEVSRHDPVPRPRVNVALAPPKGDRLAWGIQKLAEIGVDAVRLVRTDRTVRFPGQAGLARLGTVAREAAMQSRRPLIMPVEAGEDFPSTFATGGVDVVLASDSPERLAAALPAEAPTAVNVFVGPEGGWTGRDLELARDRGARFASLGPGVLRTETAAIVGAALALSRYGRLG